MHPIRTYYNFLLWGMALVLVDLRTNRADALPDYAGYALMALAFHHAGGAGLRPDAGRVGTVLAVAASLLDLASVVDRPTATLETLAGLAGAGALATAFVLVADHAAQVGHEPLRSRAIFLAGLVAVTSLLGLILPPWSTRVSRESGLFLLLVFAGLILLYFATVLQARNLPPPPGSGGRGPNAPAWHESI